MTIQGLAGSAFELRVDDAATVEGVSKRIAERLDMKPGSMLVLTSGGHVLVESQPLLKQVHGKEISFVLTPVNLLQAAKSFWRATANETKHSLSVADLSAMNAIS